MKRISPLILFICLAQTLPAQHTVESLIQTGVAFHDAKEYDKAINTYKIALQMEPNSAMINYELALSYLEGAMYDSAIKYSDKVISLNKQFVPDAYIAKASSLDYAGKTDESIQLLESAIRKFDRNHLMYYNLGYNYVRKKDYKKAEAALTNAIKVKSTHASSHLLLGSFAAESGQKVPSLLSLYYFLLLEPDTERSKAAYMLLQRQMTGNVKADADDPNKINVFLNPDASSDEGFRAAELMLSLLSASALTAENKEKTQEELFRERTKTFFGILGELKKKKNKGLVWEGYVPFFHALSESEHLETFCHYISHSMNPSSSDWLMSNRDRLKKFGEWADKNNLKI